MRAAGYEYLNAVIENSSLLFWLVFFMVFQVVPPSEKGYRATTPADSLRAIGMSLVVELFSDFCIVCFGPKKLYDEGFAWLWPHKLMIMIVVLVSLQFNFGTFPGNNLIFVWGPPGCLSQWFTINPEYLQADIDRTCACLAQLHGADGA